MKIYVEETGNGYWQYEIHAYGRIVYRDCYFDTYAEALEKAREKKSEIVSKEFTGVIGYGPCAR